MRTVAVVALLALAVPARADDLQTDQSGKGAVLCTYLMVQAAEAYSRACGGNDAMREELQRALSRIETFIAENSARSVRVEDLERTRTFADAQVCDDPYRHIYDNIASLGPEGLRAAIDDHLSVPREPVINPCH